MQNKITANDIAVERVNNYPGRPTLIFLHDSLGCIDLWRDFPAQMARLTQYNVLIYDRQGYGKSCSFRYAKRNNYYMELEADILNDLLAEWKIEKAILFGHSDGGSIALIAAAKYPEKILSIITEGAHVFVEDITIKGIEEAIALYRTTDLKIKLEKYHGNKTEEMFWAWAATWTTPEFKTWNIEKFLPLIGCRSLIIQGEDDEYGTLQQVEKIVTQTTGASEKLILPEVKHTPHKEASKLVLESAADFVLKLVS